MIELATKKGCAINLGSIQIIQDIGVDRLCLQKAPLALSRDTIQADLTAINATQPLPNTIGVAEMWIYIYR